MKKYVLGASVVALLTSTAFGQVIWSDSFETYAETANLSGPYTQIYPTYPFQLDAAKGYLSSKSIHSGITTANNQSRMYINLSGGPVGASDAAPLKVEFMVDTDEAYWHTRDYIELRSYSGGAYGVGTLNQLLALGFTSSGVDTTRVNQRILYGPTGSTGWGNLTDLYATRATIAAEGSDWTKLAMVIKSETIEYYVNDNLDTTKSITPGLLYDSLVIGSGLTTARDVWYDNLSVSIVPEPSSLALALLGGFGLFFARLRRN